VVAPNTTPLPRIDREPTQVTMIAPQKLRFRRVVK
jgi:hypothetical protein